MKRTIATAPGEADIHIELDKEAAAALEAEWAAEKARIAEEQAKYGYIDARVKEYPKIGDQLDAILKHLNYMQMKGETNLIVELDGIVGQWLKVKKDFPKPTQEVTKE